MKHHRVRHDFCSKDDIIDVWYLRSTMVVVPWYSVYHGTTLYWYLVPMVNLCVYRNLVFHAMMIKSSKTPKSFIANNNKNRNRHSSLCDALRDA